MNPLALAVQGIGFAVALVAVQGIGPDTAKVVTPISYNVTTHDWVKVHRDDILKVAATATIPPIIGEATLEPVEATGAAKVGVTTHKGSGSLAPITASGQASFKVASSQATTNLGQIVATGQHDMEDEDILAMFLTLLDS